MTDYTNGKSLEQHNHGPGTFIGRDNYDIHYELLDPKTKTVLAKLSKEAPGLAILLEKALREGIVSPEIVAALQSAVRNINDDVVDALWCASRNINPDVASSLEDTSERIERINNQVAAKVLNATEAVTEATNSLDHAVRSLRNEQNTHRSRGVEYWNASELSSAAVTEISISGKAKFKLVFWSVIIGIVIGGAIVMAFTLYLINR